MFAEVTPVTHTASNAPIWVALIVAAIGAFPGSWALISTLRNRYERKLQGDNQVGVQFAKTAFENLQFEVTNLKAEREAFTQERLEWEKERSVWQTDRVTWTRERSALIHKVEDLRNEIEMLRRVVARRGLGALPHSHSD